MIRPAIMAHVAAPLIGAPYRRDADGSDGAWNCWALVREVFRRCGVLLPANPVDAVRAHLCAPAVVGPGTVLLMRCVSDGGRHVGIVLDRGRVLHAVDPCVQVSYIAQLPLLGLIPGGAWEVFA